eukprot:g447.t1
MAENVAAVLNADEAAAGYDAAGKKAMSKKYTKKTLLEHIKSRPDTYIGSTQAVTDKMWVFDAETGKMVNRETSYVPGMYKIFDEILVNAADNKQRDDTMKFLKVDIDAESGTIKVTNGGKGIPIVMHEEHGMYIPEMVFGHLLTGDNYHDSEERVVGGRNGYGAKLANIFSTKFTVETSDSQAGKKYVQTWTNNMSKVGKPKITKSKKDYTTVTFTPDFERFGMEGGLDADTVALLTKRVYDIAGTTAKDVKVSLNGKKLPVADFRDYASLYMKQSEEENEENFEGLDKKEIAKRKKALSKRLVHLRVNERWEVCVCMSSDQQPQQVSFVNSICTMKGGEHVKLITSTLAEKLTGVMNKKSKGVEVKAHQIKNSLWVFVNALIVNPAFDSQTKETLTTRKSKFGPRKFLPELPDKFIKQVEKCGIVDEVLHWAKAKAQRDLKRKAGGRKTSKLTGIPKLDDANNAGGRKSNRCTLILTEGDSAKALAIAGLSVVGRDNYGVFPLKGKMLNVRDATHKVMMKNAEVANVCKILGLQFGKEYTDTKSLRYGHIMIMTDQDHDGSHIKGLIINMLHNWWPSLLKLPGFLQVFITPIVKVTRKGKSKAFYTVPEYEAWKEDHDGGRGWRIKYFKGLGTSTAKEAKEYFANLDKHLINFAWESDAGDADDRIDMAFSKKRVEDRKEWLNSYKSGDCIDFNVDAIDYVDFIDKELILFSRADNLRSLPCVIDGFKPSQRKVLFACFKRNLIDEIKVAQLAGYVSEHAAYHHGEASLAQTIVSMAQDFVGSNNINILMPQGQFGTRLMGGKDQASARYIFTQLSKIARLIFHAQDDPLLNYQEEDGQNIEPDFYVPIIPMLLVNGASGIGTGWSCEVPNFNPRDIIDNLRRLLASPEPSIDDVEPMRPWYSGFSGTIEEEIHKKKGATGKFVVRGCFEREDFENHTIIKITELPVGKWVSKYKEDLEDPKKFPEGFVLDIRENHTETKVSFTIKISAEAAAKLKTDADVVQKFNLSTTISLTNMTCFNSDGKILQYPSASHIIVDFFKVRMALYEARKAHMVKTLKSEFERLENIVRFILEVISGTIVVSNRPKSALLDELEEKSYAKVADAYDYLLSLPLWSLTMERVQKLKKERAEKESELDRITAMSPTKMWLNDLSALEDALSDLAIEGTAGPPPTLAFAAASAKPKKKVAKKKAAAKKVTAKKATVAAKKVEEDDGMSSDDGEFMSLFARIKKLQTGVAEPRPAKVTKPKKTLRRKKEEKKEEEEEDVDAFSVSELSESLPSTPANRENSPKRKRKPRTKMTGLAALGMSDTVSSESPSMGKHAKKKVKQSTTTALRKRSTRAKKAVTYKYSDDDDACVVEDDDDDDDFDATFSCSGSDSDWTG